VAPGGGQLNGKTGFGVSFRIADIVTIPNPGLCHLFSRGPNLI